MNFEWLAGVDTLWGVLATLVCYAGLLVWTVTRPRSTILQGAPDRAWWRDLRLWIVPILAGQICLYLTLR